MEWCIRQLYNTTIILYNITSIVYNHHTDIYSLINIKHIYLSIYLYLQGLRPPSSPRTARLPSTTSTLFPRRCLSTPTVPATPSVEASLHRWFLASLYQSLFVLAISLLELLSRTQDVPSPRSATSSKYILLKLIRIVHVPISISI